MPTLLIPKSFSRVVEAVSAKRREKDAAKRIRTKKEEEDAKQAKFSAYNEQATKALSDNPEWRKSVEAHKEANKEVRPPRSTPLKQEHNKQVLTAVQKTRIDGVTQNYLVGDGAKPLNKFRPTNKDHHSISPNKGGGAAILGKGSSDLDSEIPDITHDKKGKAYKVPLTGDAKRKAHILGLIESNKANPSKEVVDFLVNAGIDTLVSKSGSGDILKKIKQIITPPLTKSKVDAGTAYNTLTVKVAEAIANKLGAHYDPDTLGMKTFESKKLAFDARMAAYKKHFETNDISSSEFLDGDVLLLDDIMTTGITVKAIHENIAGFHHVNKEGSRTSGQVSDTPKKSKLKGTLHTLAILKNY